MKLKWVNHSSFLLEFGKIRLLSDPWIDGYVFDSSWAQLSPTKFSYADFAHVTHIWFSHEHPDHFFPPNLQRIPRQIRNNITILFQATAPRDGRVRKFCQDLGFKAVIELHPEWCEIGNGLSILCQPAGRGDSWLAIKAADRLLLNLNDCIYMSEEELVTVKQRIGSVDALITQFSYASWWGNPTEEDLWSSAAEDALLKIRREIDVLGPKDVVLSASYVFFCHEENQYMNKHINRVSRAYKFVLENGKARPIVLYPGDEWLLGARWDSSVAVSRYEADYDAALNDPVRVVSSIVPLGQIVSCGDSFMKNLGRTNSFLLLRRLPAATINVTDHKVSLRLSADGLKTIGRLRHDEHDVALSSSALLYCLRFSWGGETLMINGRFCRPAKGDHQKFFRWFSIAQSNSRGTYFDHAYYTRKLKAKARKLFRFPNGPIRQSL